MNADPASFETRVDVEVRITGFSAMLTLNLPLFLVITAFDLFLS